MAIPEEVPTMEKRVFLLLSIAILICSAFAYAEVIPAPPFFISLEAVNNKIADPVKDYAEFYVVVENKGEIKDTFKLLYLEDPKWSFQALPDPISRQITVLPGETGKIHILVKGNVGYGMHWIRVSVESVKTGKISEDVMKIQVGKSVPYVTPEPDFDVDVSVPSQMDPKGTYTILVNLKNNNARLLEDVDIKLSSSIVNEETKATVNPNETKSASFAVLLMDNIMPQQDQLHVVVTYQNETFYEGDHNFEVVEYMPPFKTDVKVEKKFLRQVRTITITNDGNVLKDDAVKIETSLKEKFFSRAVPKFSTVKENGKYYFSWPASLQPNESMEIKLTTSYRILLLFALAILVWLGYRLATSNPLVVMKKVTAVRKHNGAISDFSVVIKLKNRGNEKVSTIRVIERVPRMVKLKQDSFEGSMHPVKMHTHDREGALLEYRFGEISPGDERIIKYKVYSALQIFGLFTMKPTVAEFLTKKGAKRTSRSNSVTVGSDEPAPKANIVLNAKKK